MATIYRPCYCTREQVRQALDIKQAAYASWRIDRAIQYGTDAVEQLTQRRFYPEDKTCKWDWPNYQYAYPWRLWLEENELAAIPTAVTTGSLLPAPVVIPVQNVICHPVNTGPPFTRIELRRDLNSAFGNNPTPQLDISITGTYGYWAKTRPAGTLAAPAGSGDLTVTVSDSVSVGVGDVLIADSERMIVTDAFYADTTVSFSGLSTASAADNQVAVPDGTKFTAGEVLLVDSEWLLVQSVIGNILNTRRAWDGSVLSSHTGGTLWARRLLSVLRGSLGTTAASHLNAAPVSVSEIPGLVRQLAVAEAVVSLQGESAGYVSPPAGLNSQAGAGISFGGSSRGINRETVAGPGIADLRIMIMNSRYTRKARSRVI